MISKPAIPVLVLLPEDAHTDYKALFSIATAYAHSGLLVSEHAKKTDRLEFTFPAIVCSSFSIELFLKFFLMLERADSNKPSVKKNFGHGLLDLWKQITPQYQQLIVGMFRSPTKAPQWNVHKRQIEIFVEALENIGETPFVKWRYVYELSDITLMSHHSIAEVLDALGWAAEYVMKERRERDLRNSE